MLIFNRRPFHRALRGGRDFDTLDDETMGLIDGYFRSFHIVYRWKVRDRAMPLGVFGVLGVLPPPCVFGVLGVLGVLTVERGAMQEVGCLQPGEPKQSCTP